MISYDISCELDHLYFCLFYFPGKDPPIQSCLFENSPQKKPPKSLLKFPFCKLRQNVDKDGEVPHLQQEVEKPILPHNYHAVAGVNTLLAYPAEIYKSMYWWYLHYCTWARIWTILFIRITSITAATNGKLEIEGDNNSQFTLDLWTEDSQCSDK